eukprot:COSAG06_NODE_78348_length_111_cov_20.083333_1_plen_27_part_10
MQGFEPVVERYDGPSAAAAGWGGATHL